MKHKVSELEGGLLAHAAALACGYRVEREDPTLEIWVVWFPADEKGTLGPASSFGPFGWRPDMKWVHGGPIIDREHIDIDHMGGARQAFAVARTVRIAARHCLRPHSPDRSHARLRGQQVRR